MSFYNIQSVIQFEYIFQDFQGLATFVARGPIAVNKSMSLTYINLFELLHLWNANV